MEISRDILNSNHEANAAVIMNPQVEDDLMILGTFHVECLDKDGNIKWEEDFPNTVVTVGKNYMLESGLAASALTTVGPYMGLISLASFSAISAADTMASHAGWLEAGVANAPTYTIPRKTCVFGAAAAGVKALSAALSFAITGTGTIKGCFIVTGVGALTTIGNTAGTLLSAGLFTGGDRAVLSGDTVNVSYSLAL